MCRAVRCKTCQKTTWAGCGSHIASVKQSVPANQWCNGKHSAAELEAASSGPGWFSRMFGR